jgi:hypothetical protein
MRISLDASSEINLRITPLIRSSLIDEWFDIDAYEPQSEPQSKPQSKPQNEPQSEPESELEL